MASEIYAAGKAALYINNFDGEKNSAGTTDVCYNKLASNRTVYRGINTIPTDNIPESGEYFRCLYYDFLKHLDIRIYGSFNGTLLYEGSYNKENEQISYENPLILHLTKTFLVSGGSTGMVKLTAYNVPSIKSTTINSERVWVETNFEVELGSINFDTLDFNSGDIVTFTITIK